MRQVVYLALAVLWLTHTDIWYWDDPSIVLGLPIGVTYHVLWSLAVSALFWFVVKYAWPEDIEAQVAAQAGLGDATGAAPTAGGAKNGGVDDR